MATDIIARGMASNAKKTAEEIYNEYEGSKWIGTRTEWDAVDKSTIKEGTIVYITDDKTVILIDEEEIKKISAQVDKNTTDIATLNTKVSENTKNISDNANAIAENAKNINTNATAIEENKTTITSLQSADTDLDRRVSALYDMGNGITHRFETDSDSAYTKTVPTGAKLASVKTIGGKSLVMRQCINPKNFAGTKEVNGVTFTASDSGKIVVNGTATGNNSWLTMNAQLIVGHKYLNKSSPTVNSAYCSYFNTSDSVFLSDNGSGVIETATVSSATFYALWIKSGTTVNNLVFCPQVYDLTTMFGAGNEPSTVEEFERIFPAAYYPYSSGTIVSAAVSEVVETGRNLLSENNVSTIAKYKNADGKSYTATPNQFWGYNSIPSFLVGQKITIAATIDTSTSSKVIGMRLSLSRGNIEYAHSQVTVGIGSVTTGRVSMAFVVKSGDRWYFNYDSANSDPVTVSDICITIGGTDTTYTPYHSTTYAIPDAVKNLPGYGVEGNIVDYENKTYTQVNSVSGTEAVPLETPIITDISDIIPDGFLRNIEVETGGTLTFKNALGDDYHIPVENETEYVVEENAVENLSARVDSADKAITTTNTQVTKLNTDVSALAAKSHAHENKTILDGISADSGSLEYNGSTLLSLDQFFAMQRTGKVYGVKVYKAEINPTSECEKTRDNAGLVCEPSTDTVEGRDDYENIPLFKWYEVNYRRYDDGFAYPTAFKGDSDYQTDNVDIGAMQMTFYYNWLDYDEYRELIISDSPNETLGLKPFELSVRADGTVMPFFIQSRYVSVLGSDGLLHSMHGKIARNQSHNNMINSYQKKGKGYWGAGSAKFTFGQIFNLIKYANKSSQATFAGVTSWSVQYAAAIQSEEKHSYFPVTTAQAANLQVGLCVSVGYAYTSGSLDRGYPTLHAHADDVRITAIEPLDDSTAAVYLDCEPFDTMPIVTDTLTRQVIMSSMHAHSGDTDSVIGHHDGSPVSTTDGKHPYRLQGVEYAIGAYEVASDTVMLCNSDYTKDVYVAKRGTAHSAADATIKSTYTKIGTIAAVGDTNADWQSGDVYQSGGAWLPMTVATASTGNRDYVYAGGTGATSGSREYLQGGGLWTWSDAGLCCLNCGNGLGETDWNFCAAD